MPPVSNLPSDTDRFLEQYLARGSRVANFSVGTVAVCVEDQDILARLKALGVGYAQGFGIHEPLPIERLPAA